MKKSSLSGKNQYKYGRTGCTNDAGPVISELVEYTQCIHFINGSGRASVQWEIPCLRSSTALIGFNYVYPYVGSKIVY